MKGFPEQPDGELESWYAKVDAKMTEAQKCMTREELVALLGEPNLEGEATNSQSPTTFFSGLGSQVTVSEESKEEFVGYQDPYRPKIRYMFALSGDRILSSWKEGAGLG